ncbi:unknown protein [Parachlamydia acanthamoebae UV-7]|uniref:Uncharacterized protein n=1 Tax=Parachlamydia acanthamoebae (strain UV7) TaxID=765952 RepID=F8KVX1_PARAV|nr:hypothetical protein pah_c014o015 [Parachlamydia acanthamoebae str. Hall's coccus]CCB85267.1 unknown protein [Parachlamydia acanthamoebae UV-7]
MGSLKEWIKAFSTQFACVLAPLRFDYFPFFFLFFLVK